MADREAREEVSLRSGRGRWVLTATALGSALGFLDATVVNVALPDLGRDLGAGVADLQWVANGYALSLGALLLIGGAVGDRYGRRRTFVLGVVWFTAASVVCAMAPSTEFLIAARVLQGVGAALLTPNSLAIVEASFRQEDQTRAIGAWSALSGLGSALGPIVGGYLVDVTSWRAVFLLNLPLGAGIVLVAARHVPESRDRTATARLDLKGAALVTVGLAGATAALTEMARPGRTPALIAIVAAVGFAGLLMFLVHERRTRDPMVPLELFDSRQFVSANVVTFAVYAALGGVFFLLVIHLQVVLGYSALAAGAASVPVTVIMLLSPYSGVLADRIGPRWQLTAGPLLLATAIAMMARIGPGDTYPRSVLPAVLVFGIGLTLTVAPITATALAAVDSAHAGIASGVNTAVSRIAGLAAVAALPPAAGLSGSDFQDPEALKHGFPVAMIVIAAVAAAGGLLAAATISNDVLRTRAESTQ